MPQLSNSGSIALDFRFSVESQNKLLEYRARTLTPHLERQAVSVLS
jgi:hypothetical protein